MTFGAVATDLYEQIKDPGNPGKTREDKTGRIDYMALNLRLCLLVNNCRHYGDRGEIVRLLGWNCTN